MDQSEHRTRWFQGQRLRPRIARQYIRVLTRLTSVGNAACTFDIVTRTENWPTANLRHVSATCAQYGAGPTLVGMLKSPLAPCREVGFSTDFRWGQNRPARMPEAVPGLPGAHRTASGPSGTTLTMTVLTAGLKPFRPLPKLVFSTDLGKGLESTGQVRPRLTRPGARPTTSGPSRTTGRGPKEL